MHSYETIGERLVTATAVLLFNSIKVVFIRVHSRVPEGRVLKCFALYVTGYRYARTTIAGTALVLFCAKQQVQQNRKIVSNLH